MGTDEELKPLTDEELAMLRKMDGPPPVRGVLLSDAVQPFAIRAVREIAGWRELSWFMDQLGLDPAARPVDRVRDFYHRCIDRLRKYQDALGELPHIIDPREEPFVEGWKACLMFVVQGAAGVNLKERGVAAAYGAFREWAKLAEKRATIDESIDAIVQLYGDGGPRSSALRQRLQALVGMARTER